MFPVYAGVILTPYDDDTGFEVFPVYAGVILASHADDANSLSVPRVCGGDPGSAHAAADGT